MSEFSIIEDFFLPLTENREEALNLKDDCAILNIPEGKSLVMTSDTLNLGVHIFENAHAADIAHKALRTNLSDLASMGAEPYCYQLCVAFPEPPTKEWLGAFTAALKADQKRFKIFCSGGDTTSSKGHLSITITALGTTEKAAEISRKNASTGQKIITSGVIGDSYIGYKILNSTILGGAFDTDHNDHFINAYHRPEPQIDLIRAIKDKVHAAIDISDGLATDLMHIARASNLSAHLNIPMQLFSKPAQTLIISGKFTIEELLTGGDDYQLIMAVNADDLPALQKAHPQLIEIGHFTDGKPALHITDPNGERLELQKHGWTHF